ncbi:MAG: DUF2029 domain-containing protein [Acidobacteria bacterium]|nr:DUF2029 domain-containing protein [Acidobacteriota bacterium]
MTIWIRSAAAPMLGLLVAAICILAIARQMPWLPAWDFPLYYSAGRLPAHEMYNVERQQADQRIIFEENIAPRRTHFFAIYLRPAVYKLVLTPLAHLSFWNAYLLWAALQAAGIIVGVYLYSRPGRVPPYLWILLPMCPPLISTVAWGQDAGLVFLIIAYAWSLGERERWFSAGAVLALTARGLSRNPAGMPIRDSFAGIPNGQLAAENAL